MEQCYQKLLEVQKIPLKTFLDDSDLHDISERNLEVAIQCVLDIGAHIIAEKGFKSPAEYEDIIIILGNEKVLSSKVAASLKGMGRFRNLLVHEYMEIDYKRVYEILQKDIIILGEFAKEILSFIKNKA